jgi:hypothetical protein
MPEIQQGIYSTISMDQCISGAKEELRMDTTDNDRWFRKLANEATRHIDAISLWEQDEECLDIIDQRVELPFNFEKLIAVRVGARGCYGNSVYVDLPFLVSCNCTTNNGNVTSYRNSFEIKDNHIVFHKAPSTSTTTTTNGVVTTVTEPATEATVAFWGLQVDENGLILVYADYERAITAYILWKYKRSIIGERDSIIYECESHKTEWIAQKKWIKSKRVQENFRNKKRQIASITNAWLVAKNFGV